jgi:predicted nucleic acid-binding protein
VAGLKYLLDTNIFLEALLAQQKAAEVKTFLTNIPLDEMCMSDLSLHSIGIILYRFGKFDIFRSFLEDVVIDGISVLSLKPVDMKGLTRIARDNKLDFDDAYQYLITERNELRLVSFDSDFDGTSLGRKTPGEWLKVPK